MDAETTHIFELLDIEVRKLNRDWITDKQLFAESDERVQLLSETAGTFFSMLRNILIENIFLIISRLTDKEVISGNVTLSMTTLLSKLGENPIFDELNSIFEETSKDSKPIREWRNRQIGHNDLKIKLSPEGNPLPKVSFGNIESIIENINQFMNIIWKEINQSFMAYTSYVIQGGVEELTTYLRIGQIASESRFDLIRIAQELQKYLQKLG